MSSRKVPPRASSRLDLGARIPRSPETPPVAAVPDDPKPASRSPSSRIGVTWLSEMMTADKNSFAVMRLLLALAVLVSHSYYLTTGQGALEPLYHWTNYTLGQHGVQLFFFLSGILVTQSLFASRDLRDYATARALRIFPALIVCVLATALILGPWLTSLPTAAAYLKDPGVAAYIAKTLSLWSGSAQLPGLFVDNTVPRAVNTSVWTLKYEVLCYFVLGLAGWIVIKMQRWRETAIALFALWLAAVFFKPTGLELHGGAKSSLEVFRYFTIFFGTGVLAFALRHYIPVHGALVLPLAYLFWAMIGTRFQEPAAAVFLGYLALWLSTFRFGGLRAFTNQNDYSYATYLYHMPVAQALLYFIPQMPVPSLILATTGIVIWLSFLSWEFVERPALNLRHSLWKKAPSSSEDAFDQAMVAAARKAGNPVRATVRSATAASAATTAAFERPLPIVRPKQPTMAEITAARASERLARELSVARSKSEAAETAVAAEAQPPAAAVVAAATTSAGSAVLPSAMSPNDVQPGAAQVWRPMPSVRRLKIHADEAPPASRSTAHVETTVASGPNTTRPVLPIQTAGSLDLMQRAAAAAMRTEAPTSEPVEAPRPRVPASRIAFATKRTAAAEAPPPASPVGTTPAEPTRAVVAVAREPDDFDVRQRVSQPRPTWTRPLPERPQPA